MPRAVLQAYGAGAYIRVGVVLQRALLVCWTVCLPVVLLWSQVGAGQWGRGWLERTRVGAAFW